MPNGPIQPAPAELATRDLVDQIDKRLDKLEDRFNEFMSNINNFQSAISEDIGAMKTSRTVMLALIGPVLLVIANIVTTIILANP